MGTLDGKSRPILYQQKKKGGFSMKKIFSIFMLVILGILLIVGCTETVPAPGSGDRSKPLIDTSSEEVPLDDLRPMLMVDGNLYLDTGKESSIRARCGVMDGEVTSTVDASEVPTKNNQSNFGVDFGYQFVSNNCIDVYMNEKWIRFEKEYSSENPIELVMFVKDYTSTGATLVFAHTDSLSSNNFQTGSWYRLEKEENGNWQEISYVVAENTIGWTDEALVINKDYETIFEVNWEWLYGKLDKGKYRISKEVIDFRKTGEYDTYILNAEFVLE